MQAATKARRSWVLYRFYDAEGVLLYIGITGDLDIRFTQHSKDKPWWRSVATVKIEHHDTAEEAAAAEVAAIKSESPRWNISHTDKARERARPRVARLFRGEVWVNMSEACRLLGSRAAEIHRMCDRGELRSRRLAGGEKIRGPRQVSLSSINELRGVPSSPA